jgi:hypothetical protein
MPRSRLLPHFGRFPLWVAVAAILSAGVSAAYVLPGWAVLRHTVEHREDLHVTSMRAEGSITFFAAAAGEASAAGLASPDGLSEASFAIKSAGRCRLEVGLGDGARSAWVWSHGQARAEGKALSFVPTALEQICQLLGASADKNDLDRYLQKLKVDTRSSSLDRLHHEVAYVLGNPSPKEPQVWIFKDEFAPARVRFADDQGVAWDVKLMGYGSPQGGEAFPRLIEISRSGELLARFTTVRTDMRAALSDRQF